MAWLTAKVLGLSVCLLIGLDAGPAQADPFFVRVYGRAYKVDPRYRPEEMKGPKPQEAMKALPPDLAKGPGGQANNADRHHQLPPREPRSASSDWRQLEKIDRYERRALSRRQTTLMALQAAHDAFSQVKANP